MAWRISLAPSVEKDEVSERACVPPFTGIAPYYDALMWDIDYQGWIDYTLRLCEKFSLKPKKVLDLACGTGTCCLILAEKGYEVFGLDESEEMLRVAEKKVEARNVAARFAKADMRSFSFEEQVDLVTCIFDSINYIVDEQELVSCFKSVNSALSSPGLFIFDMNTEYGLSTFWAGSTMVRDEKGVFSVWRNSYDSDTKIARLDLTLFAGEGEAYRRVDEVHLERSYSLDQLKSCLREAEFDKSYFYHHLTFSKPARTSKRVMVVAKKG